MEEEAQLKRKRASIKSRLTIFKNFINNLEQGIPLNDAYIIELEERVSKITGLIDEFENIQMKIEGIVENPELEITHREEFDKAFFSAIAAGKKLIADAQAKTAKTNLNNQLSSQSSASVSDPDSRLKGIKLPIIELPKFDGRYEFWLEFRNTYQSLIHDNESISDIQRFHYLRSSLIGSAIQVIQSLEFTPTNYAVAWDILCKRYDNYRLLVHNHVKALFNLEPVSKESSSKIRKLIDEVLKHLRALDTLKEPTSHWDTLIIYLITTKLDKVTIREWEEYKADIEIPSLDNLLQFLRSRADLLETLEVGNIDKDKENKVKSNMRSLISVKDACICCDGDHITRDCKEFLKLSVNERIVRAQGAKLCLNCLRKGHFSRFCKSSSCRKCRRRHHTLLHHERPNEVSTDSHKNAQVLPITEVPSTTLSASSVKQVLLSTASILIFDSHEQPHNVRALLDCGSQSSFITTSICRVLQLELETVNLSVSGLTQQISHSQSKCIVKICCNRGSFISKLPCFLLPQITGDLPNFRFDSTDLHIPSNIRLADPDFNIPGPVDILIGADLFWSLIGVGQIKLGPNQPILQKTKLGWIISGPVGLSYSNKVVCNVSKDLEMQLTKFWEQEEFPDRKPWSQEELACENHFINNTKRNEDGRFIVKIPFKRSVSNLGDSQQQAKRRFWSLEKRLQADQNLKHEYVKFISEYQTLKHMSKVNEHSDNVASAYYMPHHGVLRESSLTTKLRVVFDASARTDSGYSINELQMVGPVIQSDLLSIILRFREHAFVITADIEKMYRQVLITPSQRPLQRILWRTDPQSVLDTYELNTVTYGTASASFLAIRALMQLAHECQSSMPNIARIIQNDFYVDDLLTGANTIEDLSLICTQIFEVLKGGRFILRKWISNDPGVLETVTYSQDSDLVRQLATHESNKTLGLFWAHQDDTLLYQINDTRKNNSVTKRAILSTISQIFDPLGVLGPCIVTAKIILQKLWEENVSWDQSVPPYLHSKWLRFKDDLTHLNDLRIPRHAICKNPVRVEIHGFSDASEQAYGACVFLRSINKDGGIFVHLLCAKSRVAPLKKITIPRLELCGALILARLVNKVKISSSTNFDSFTFWCDSTIVLGWLNAPLNLLKTFVANRVSEVQSLTQCKFWRYVSTKDNPADFISRGINPSQLGNLDIWWHGPQWLSKVEHHWPTIQPTEITLPELRQSVQSLIVTQSPIIQLLKFSNLNKLQRIVAYCLRFIDNCRLSPEKRSFNSTTVAELQRSLIILVKIAQEASFPQELSNLKHGKHVSPKSKLLNLNPFLDNEGIIRVGGRLGNSHFNYNKKHPIVLDGHSHIMKLIFKEEHKRLLHPGPQLLLAAVRDMFWPISGRNAARKIVHECIRCFKANPKCSNPLMGNLPGSRVTPTFPFASVGVDYAGPFLIKDKKGRGCKFSKCYLSLFVCFNTKAVHLELVTDLTKDAFILALRRFVSRRGKPVNIYSDNGTNFVGARNELSNLGNFLINAKQELIESFRDEGLTWHFIPPHSPHFGGIWESGVKSVKHHLKRVLGNASLTFEEFYTVLVQIEAVLNSRPLSPLSSDASDPLPLTPSHFLIGRPLIAIPDNDCRNLPENRLSHYQRIQQIVQHFWTRWAKEYVSELQCRTKWKLQGPSIKEGALVVIKEDNVPPLKWVLGRISKVYRGSDTAVRVVKVKTIHGEIKRAISKVCALPLN